MASRGFVFRLGERFLSGLYLKPAARLWTGKESLCRRRITVSTKCTATNANHFLGLGMTRGRLTVFLALHITALHKRILEMHASRLKGAGAGPCLRLPRCGGSTPRSEDSYAAQASASS